MQKRSDEALLEYAHSVIDVATATPVDREAIHPGAVLVVWFDEREHTQWREGLEPEVVLVVDTDGNDVDYAEAEEAAVEFLTKRNFFVEGTDTGADAVERVSKKAVPHYVDSIDIEREIIDQLQRLADFGAAESYFTYYEWDERIDENAYSGAIHIATFGNAVAVEGDALVGPHWAKELGVDSRDLWEGLAEGKLYRWLQKNGWERIEAAGGDWPGGSEQEIDGDTVVRAVSRELNVPEERVKFVLEDKFKRDRFGDLYVGSDSGSIEVWGKPIEEEIFEIPYNIEDEAGGVTTHYVMIQARSSDDAVNALVWLIEGENEDIWGEDDRFDTSVERTERKGTSPFRQMWCISGYDTELEDESDEEAGRLMKCLTISERISVVDNERSGRGPFYEYDYDYG